ncbi:MAG: MogA/MoaB family molybdenum cofactor biosynthesis protein, partial [Thermoanaerobaculia bacterium]|nr:MogA/MoaB family molybdenum cofactor biosynthesis protein [Thermoanaerobaculia bacterium]
MRVAILTISDRAYHGERADKGGPAIADAVGRLLAGAAVVEQTILPDERDDIAWNLKRLADTGAADLVLTTGGTGLSPRDVTPQATLDILDYEVPGLAEVMRAATRGSVPTAILSRQVAAVCGRTLIVNLPGSPSGALACLEAVASVLGHAVATLRGEAGDDHPGARGERR